MYAKIVMAGPLYECVKNTGFCINKRNISNLINAILFVTLKHIVQYIETYAKYTRHSELSSS